MEESQITDGEVEKKRICFPQNAYVVNNKTIQN